MHILNNIVLSSFVEQYYSENYITKLHNNLVEKVDSYAQYKVITRNENQYIITNDDILEIPKIPQEIIKNWEDNKAIFIEGIMKSGYFIS